MACTCFVGNGGVFQEDSSGTMVAVTTEDYGGEACRCRPQDNVPFVNLQLDYGCFGQGSCLSKVVYFEVDDAKNPGFKIKLPVACAPDAGHYTRLTEIIDPETGATVRELQVEAAHVGTHVPFNNYLYLTDESGDALNYIDLDSDGNIASGVVKAYNPANIVVPGIEVIGLRCNNGYYQDERGKATCKACPGGQFTPGVANHVENYNTNPGPPSPGLYTYQVCSDNGDWDNGCNVGYAVSYVLDWGADQYGCGLTGYYKTCTIHEWMKLTLNVPQWETSEAYTQCYDCPPGRASEGAQGQCTNCKNGYYQDEHGKSQCKSCPSGKITPNVDHLWSERQSDRNTGYYRCTDCPIHTQAQTEDGSPVGDMDNYVSSGGNRCIRCAPGSDNHNGGQCDWCAAGMYRDVNTVSNVDAENACKNCPTGKHSSATATPEGTLADNSATQYTTDIVGSSRCDICPAGRYQNQNAQAYCKSCGGGTYQDGTGQDWCKNCPDGTYMPISSGYGIVTDYSRNNEADCASCPTAKRGKGSGHNSESTGCENCPAGQYQNQNRQPDCKNCGTGKFLDTTGSGSSSDCKSCPNGKYGDQTGLAGCKDCPGGKYLNSAGNDASSDCKTCGRGYHSSAGANACTACPSGKGTKSTGEDSSNDCGTCTGTYTGSDYPGDQDLSSSGCGSCSWTDKNYPSANDYAGNDCPGHTSTSRSHWGGGCWAVYCTFNCNGNPCPGGYSLHGNYADHSSCPGFECRRECQRNSYCSTSRL